MYHRHFTLQILQVIQIFLIEIYAIQSIPFCIQRIFYNLQAGKGEVRTFELLNAFGWSQREMNQQHDVNEFFLILGDTMEKQMQDTPVAGTYTRLFEGTYENVVSCIDIQLESIRKENFNCISLSLEGDVTTIEESFMNYVKAEELTGENQYETDFHGRQDARKFIRFRKFPPVLQLQVNRFSYNFEQDQMAKINSQFKFGEILDLDAVLPHEMNLSQAAHSQRDSFGQKGNVYHLHSILIHRGTLGAGHYFAFIKPQIDEQWYEFNDDKVIPLLNSSALSIGGGGFDSIFDHKDGQICEKMRTNYTSAYMLVYIRESDREEILREVPVQEIPAKLKERFEEENQINRKLNNDSVYLADCGQVHLVTWDIIQSWKENGVMQGLGDIYQGDSFYANENARLKIMIERKATIMELLTKLRKSKFKLPSKLAVYRVRYDRNGGNHIFQLVPRENYNVDIFGKNQKIQIIFICDKADPRSSLLSKITDDEKKLRNIKFESLITFVKRRDLDRNYISTYENKMREVWRIKKYDQTGKEIIEENEIKIDDQNDYSFLNNNEDQEIEEESIEKSPQQIGEEATQEILKQKETDQNMQESQLINTSPLSRPMERLLEQSDNDNKVLIFVKKFKVLPHKDKPEKDPYQELSMITPMLLNKQMLFSEAGDFIRRTLDMLEEPVTDRHQIVVEMLSKSGEAYDEFQLLDADQEVLDSDFKGFMRTTNHDQVTLNALADGSILIFVEEEHLLYLDFFLREKSTELWLQLCQVEGENIKQWYSKHKFSNQSSIKDLYNAIQQIVLNYDDVEIDSDCIQLIKREAGKVRYGEKDIDIKRDLLHEENIIKFEILPFPLKEIQDKTIVKVIHYDYNLKETDDPNMSGTKGFTFLLPPEIKLYDLTQIMYRKYLQESLPGMINHLQLYTYYLTDKSQTPFYVT